MRTSFKNFLVLLFMFVSFVGFSATVQDILDKCDTIDNITRNLLSEIRSSQSRLGGFTYTFTDSDGNSQSINYMDSSDLRYIMSSLDNQSQSVNYLSQRVGLIRQLATSLESSWGSYDDTDLMAELEEIEEAITNIGTSLDDTKQLVMDFMAWFTENQDKITNYFDNWGNFTNSLPSFSYYNFITNHQSNLSISSPTQNNGGPHFVSNNSGVLSLSTSTLGSVSPYVSPVGSILRSNFGYISDFFSMLHIDIQYFGSGLMNTLYTNTVDTISFHRDYQKNFKSFSDFTTNKLAEINSIFYNNSPLEDLQADVNPSNIYNFVTNYYIKVSTDPSGSASENKTNWFNRIEMLLTALVFRPQEVAPSNDFSNVKDNEKKQFEDSIKDFLVNDIGDIQQNSENVLSDFEKTKTSLLSFFSHLNNSFSSLASIPSHIEFFQIDTSNGVRRVEISTQGTFATFADTLRAITTLCWISFFVVVAFLLSRWLFIKFSSILKFCYSVFKTLIGIG